MRCVLTDSDLVPFEPPERPLGLLGLRTLLRNYGALIAIKFTNRDVCFLGQGPRHAMDSKRKVEIFSAGCAFCHEVIDVVRREAGSSSQIIVHNMMDARSLARAEEFGIRSVPAVVIDGKLAPCCTGSVGH